MDSSSLIFFWAASSRSCAARARSPAARARESAASTALKRDDFNFSASSRSFSISRRPAVRALDNEGRDDGGLPSKGGPLCTAAAAGAGRKNNALGDFRGVRTAGGLPRRHCVPASANKTRLGLVAISAVSAVSSISTVLSASNLAFSSPAPPTSAKPLTSFSSSVVVAESQPGSSGSSPGMLAVASTRPVVSSPPTARAADAEAARISASCSYAAFVSACADTPASRADSASPCAAANSLPSSARAASAEARRAAKEFIFSVFGVTVSVAATDMISLAA